MATSIELTHRCLRRRRSAVRTLTIIVTVNAAIFTLLRLCAIISPSLAESLISRLALPASGESAPWGIVTYMATHYDTLHISLNMLWFCWFGLILADSGAGWHFISATYVGGGVMAALGYLALAHGDDSFLIGSSGAVMAIVAAAATVAPRARLDLHFLRSVSVATAAGVIMALWSIGMAWGLAGAHIAHIAGIIGGIMAGGLLRRSWRRRAPEATVSSPEATTLLDKLRSSGFDSLTADERRTLVSASSPSTSRK
ncbi:MAG: rhomboid family intramembrane serine protease [Pseudoflavonifractor sp.]|nr:rhomboid family intramembrane serine protease [Alloprevotella sp.]MCM1116023.1 rhomboid family intramembrane serine protease [Pseudoflavonifractor sp.]